MNFQAPSLTIRDFYYLSLDKFNSANFYLKAPAILILSSSIIVTAQYLDEVVVSGSLDKGFTSNELID